jgi:transmembrane sensor
MARWLGRLKPGTATTSDLDAFRLWRARSLDNEAAFREIAAYRRLVRASSEAATPADLPAETPRRGIDRRALLAGGAIAATVAGIGLVRPPLGLWPSFDELMADHRTVPGGRLTFAPTIGVRVEMNTRTSVSLIHGGNGIHLLAGEAYVAVAEPARSFFVRVGDALVTAGNGGIMDIGNWGEGLCVTCLAGALQVQRDSASTAATAGEQILYSAEGRPLRTVTDVTVATAWRHGLLIFDNTPLSRVIDEINRYREGHIVLTDTNLGSRTVDGIFHTDQIDSTVTQIQQLLNVRLTYLPGGLILIGS